MDELDVGGDIAPSTPTNGHSGITLVLPSLRALKAANAGKKPKPKQASDLEQRPKIPRPIKLKPLKEVLTKLITQIKKKDDYAFFIHPVDPAHVPGYADVITNPMDFGTMMSKVTKGKYRSLDEFTADFRLVTTNAKTFNPPGSIYHTEADRLETWGLDHIARASAHVIEYETDWNIDIEQEEDAASQLPVNIEDEVSTPRDVDGSMAAGSPAPSMTPAPGHIPVQGKRGPRGPYKKHAQTMLSEGLDAEGRMPGAKDGVGAFPPGSEWAELMVALKIKGKRYKTKRERLRFEREGPPYQPDGSLDYTEMEDPFSLLNVLVPEALARPQVMPLYLPPFAPTPPTSTEDHQSQSPMPMPPLHAHLPITVPHNRPAPVLSTLSNNTPAPVPLVTSTSTTVLRPPKKRLHWTIVRNVSARSRAKEKESDATTDETKTISKPPRDAGPADYGTFATFVGELVTTAVGPNADNAATRAVDYIYGSEQRLNATIRSTIEHRGVKRKREPSSEVRGEDGETFFTDERAVEGWDYLRNVVYGGVDGYAYVRSLAEFVAPSIHLDKVLEAEGHGGQVADGEKPLETGGTVQPLGVPLGRYIEDNLVDMITRGRHGWLRDVLLPGAAAILDGSCSTSVDESISPFDARLSVLPGMAKAMASFKALSEEPLDLAALIRRPEELAKETALEGGVGEGDRVQIERALTWSVEVIQELSRRAQRDQGEAKAVVKKEMEHTGIKEESMDVDPKAEADEDHNDSPTQSDKADGSEAESDKGQDPLVERLRMNLLALAKRAPLDRIAKLPVDLVPENIRSIVPIAQ